MERSNLVFALQITGIIVLSVGASVQSVYNNYHAFLSDRFFSLPAFCIATGVIIFLIAAVGFYGAYMENYIVNMVVSNFKCIIVLIFIIYKLGRRDVKRDLVDS